MSKMQEFPKQVILLDSSGNNPVIAKRIERKKGEYYFPFPLYDKDGNEITEHKRPYENDGIPLSSTSDTLETPTEKVDKKSSNGA